MYTIISFNSIKTFFLVNGFLFAMGYMQDYLLCLQGYIIIFYYLTLLIKNYVLLYFINNGIKDKEDIFITNEYPYELIESYPYEFHANVFVSTAMETATYIGINQINLLDKPYNINISFIPISFAYELIFDFFHYWTHRAMHHPYIYKYSHKKHHKFPHPKPIITFYQDPMDIIVTNIIPTMLTIYILQPVLNIHIFHYISIYKTFIEISGHTGKKLRPTSSFTQCVWLPRLLNIELYSEDHDLHHSANNCNYGKRFSVWDKVFDTYKKN